MCIGCRRLLVGAAVVRLVSCRPRLMLQYGGGARFQVHHAASPHQLARASAALAHMLRCRVIKNETSGGGRCHETVQFSAWNSWPVDEASQRVNDSGTPQRSKQQAAMQ